jgi:hypothetical protein
MHTRHKQMKKKKKKKRKFFFFFFFFFICQKYQNRAKQQIIKDRPELDSYLSFSFFFFFSYLFIYFNLNSFMITVQEALPIIVALGAIISTYYMFYSKSRLIFMK